jgi:hypothetical protein
MECKQEQNRTTCTPFGPLDPARRGETACTYEPCPRKGLCCQCIAYHHENDELPGCVFPAPSQRCGVEYRPEVERSYEPPSRRCGVEYRRSITHFVSCYRGER